MCRAVGARGAVVRFGIGYALHWWTGPQTAPAQNTHHSSLERERHTMKSFTREQDQATQQHRRDPVMFHEPAIPAPPMRTMSTCCRQMAPAQGHEYSRWMMFLVTSGKTHCHEGVIFLAFLSSDHCLLAGVVDVVHANYTRL